CIVESRNFFLAFSFIFRYHIKRKVIFPGKRKEIFMVDRSKGILFMLLAAFSFSLMETSVKLAVDLPLMQKVFVRNLFVFFVAMYIMFKNIESFKGNNLSFLTLRSVLGLLGVILYFFALSNLVLADASILNNTSPFFVIVFSFIFLKEPIKKMEIPILLL